MENSTPIDYLLKNYQIETIKKFRSNSNAKNQGLEKEITIRTIWIEGIEKINGKPV